MRDGHQWSANVRPPPCGIPRIASPADSCGAYFRAHRSIPSSGLRPHAQPAARTFPALPDHALPRRRTRSSSSDRDEVYCRKQRVRCHSRNAPAIDHGQMISQELSTGRSGNRSYLRSGKASSLRMPSRWRATHTPRLRSQVASSSPPSLSRLRRGLPSISPTQQERSAGTIPTARAALSAEG